MNYYRLKACPKCNGDLARDEGDWICLQCGSYYYVGLYPPDDWRRDSPLFPAWPQGIKPVAAPEEVDKSAARTTVIPGLVRGDTASVGGEPLSGFGGSNGGRAWPLPSSPYSAPYSVVVR